MAGWASQIKKREDTLTTRTGSQDPVTPTTPIEPARLGRRDRAKQAVLSGGLLGPKTDVKGRDVSSGVSRARASLTSAQSVVAGMQ